MVERKAAARLLGRKLDGGWTVKEALIRKGSQTGGFFSQGYLVESDVGSQAFLKAMDFSDALQADDFARAIEQIARQFNFERDLLELCKERKMRNVVRSIGGGVVDVEGDGNPLNRVQYFLFEPADGDIRKVMDSFEEVTAAWVLQVLHESAVGLRQLHGSMIAHQDFKPSNVLSFGGGGSVKVGDLGSASVRGQGCPRDGLRIPGQLSYAPPEQLYSFLHQDWTVRRVGSDMYQLGSMAVFLLAGTSFNALLASRLDPAHHWKNWQGEYREVLPHLKLAFSEVLEELGRSMTGRLLAPLLSIVKELCEPELEMRGDPSYIRRRRPQFTLEPYVSRLGNLRRSAEYSAKRVLGHDHNQ